MDELNLYDDLDEFQEQQEKKSKELQAAEDKYQESLKTIEALREENNKLKKNIQRIELSFQNLLDTARTEIKRKDKEIERLRKEKDDICFRRKIPYKTAAATGETQQLTQKATTTTAHNPFKSTADNETSINETASTSATTTKYSKLDPNVATNKRHGGHDDAPEHLSDYKRHRAARDEQDSKYPHKHHRTEHNDQNRNRERNRETDKESHSRSRDYNRNHSRERKDYEDKTSSSRYKTSKSSESPERSGRRYDRSQSRERARSRNYERHRSHDYKTNDKYSKTSSKSPTQTRTTDTKRGEERHHVENSKPPSTSDKFHKHMDVGKQKSKDFKDKEYHKNTPPEKVKNLIPEKETKQKTNEDSKSNNKNDTEKDKPKEHQKSENETSSNLKTLHLNEKVIIRESKEELNKAESNKQLETPKQNVGRLTPNLPEQTKLSTPHKVDLFNELFGPSPSENTTNANGSCKSTSSLLKNIKNILAKTSQTAEVLTSATTSPGDYTDLSSGMITPKEHDLVDVSSSENTRNDEQPPPPPANNREEIETNIDNCFILTQNVDKEIKTIACVDLTQCLDEDIENVENFIQITGLDLCGQDKNKIKNSSNKEESSFTSKILNAEDNTAHMAENMKDKENLEMDSENSTLTTINDSKDVEILEKDTFSTAPETEKVPSNATEKNCSYNENNKVSDDSELSVVEVSKENLEFEKVLLLNPSEKHDIVQESASSSGISNKAEKTIENFRDIADNVDSEVVLLDTVNSGKILTFKNPYNKENLDESCTQKKIKENVETLQENETENNSTKQSVEETQSKSTDEEQTTPNNISNEENTLAQSIPSVPEDDQTSFNFKSTESKLDVAEHNLASTKSNTEEDIAENDEQLESPATKEQKESSDNSASLQITTLDPKTPNTSNDIEEKDPANIDKNLHELKVVAEDTTTDSITTISPSQENPKTQEIEENKDSLSDNMKKIIDQTSISNENTDSNLPESSMNSEEGLMATDVIIDETFDEIENVETSLDSLKEKEVENQILLKKKDVSSSFTENIVDAEKSLEVIEKNSTHIDATESDLTENSINKEESFAIKESEEENESSSALSEKSSQEEITKVPIAVKSDQPKIKSNEEFPLRTSNNLIENNNNECCKTITISDFVENTGNNINDHNKNQSHDQQTKQTSAGDEENLIHPIGSNESKALDSNKNENTICNESEMNRTEIAERKESHKDDNKSNIAVTELQETIASSDKDECEIPSHVEKTPIRISAKHSDNALETNKGQTLSEKTSLEEISSSNKQQVGKTDSQTAGSTEDLANITSAESNDKPSDINKNYTLSPKSGDLLDPETNNEEFTANITTTQHSINETSKTESPTPKIKQVQTEIENSQENEKPRTKSLTEEALLESAALDSDSYMMETQEDIVEDSSFSKCARTTKDSKRIEEESVQKPSEQVVESEVLKNSSVTLQSEMQTTFKEPKTDSKCATAKLSSETSSDFAAGVSDSLVKESKISKAGSAISPEKLNNFGAKNRAGFAKSIQTLIAKTLKKQLEEFFMRRDRTFPVSKTLTNSTSNKSAVVLANEQLSSTKYFDSNVMESNSETKVKSLKDSTEKSPIDIIKEQTAKYFKMKESTSNTSKECGLNQTPLINEVLEPGTTESTSQGDKEKITVIQETNLKKKALACSKTTVDIAEPNEVPKTSYVSKLTPQINDVFETQIKEPTKKGEKEKKTHEQEKDSIKRTSDSPKTSADIAESNEVPKTVYVSKQTLQINDVSETQIKEPSKKCEKEKKTLEQERYSIKRASDSPKTSANLAESNEVPKTVSVSKASPENNEVSETQISEPTNKGEKEKDLIKKASTSPKTSAVTANSNEETETNYDSKQTPQINEVSETQIREPTNKGEKEKELIKRASDSPKTSANTPNSNEETDTSYVSKQSPQINEVSETQIREPTNKGEKEESTHKQENYLSKKANATPIASSKTPADIVDSNEKTETSCRNKKVAESVDISKSSKQILPVGSKMSAVIDSISNRMQKTLDDIAATITNYESEVNKEVNDEPNSSTSTHRQDSVMNQQVGELECVENDLQRQTSNKDAANEGVKASVCATVVNPQEGLVADEIFKSNTKFLNNNTISSKEQTLRCEANKEINNDSSIKSLAPALDPQTISTPSHSFRKLITKEINIEGEIVEVVKIQLNKDSVPIDLNKVQNTHESINISQQIADEISSAPECSLSKNQAIEKITVKTNQTNLKSHELEKSPLKEFKTPRKPEIQAPSKEIGYLAPKTLPKVTQHNPQKESYHQTISSILPETFSTQPVLPSISTTSPTPSNFSGIFSKKSSSSLTAAEDDFVKSKKKSPHLMGKPKEYILPAASVLCNVDNLENATKTNKKLHWELLENKNEMTEIEDDADVDTTDEEEPKIKQEPPDTTSTSPKQMSPQTKPSSSSQKLQKSSPSETDTQTEDESLLNELKRQGGSYKKLKAKSLKVHKTKQRKHKLSKTVKARLKAIATETLVDSGLIIQQPFSIVLPKRPVGRPRKIQNCPKVEKVKEHKKRGRKPKPKVVPQNDEEESPIENIDKTRSNDSFKGKKRNYMERLSPDVVTNLENSMRILSSSVERLEICGETCSSRDSVKQRKFLEKQAEKCNTSIIYEKQDSSTENINTSARENPVSVCSNMLHNQNRPESLSVKIKLPNIDSATKPQTVVANSRDAEDVRHSDTAKMSSDKTDLLSAPIIKDPVIKYIELPSCSRKSQDKHLTIRSDSEPERVQSHRHKEKKEKSKKSKTKLLMKKKLKSKMKNKVTAFISLEDIGIKVRPLKGHLSSFKIPKIKKDTEETIDNSWKLEAYEEVETVGGGTQEGREAREHGNEIENNVQQRQDTEKTGDEVEARKYKKDKQPSSRPETPKEKETSSTKENTQNSRKFDIFEPLENESNTDSIQESQNKPEIKDVSKTPSNYIINFDNKTKSGKRKLFSPDMYDEENVEITPDNNSRDRYREQCQYLSETHELNPVKFKRTSLNFPKKISDICQAPSLENNEASATKTIGKSRRKSSHVHRRILDSSSDEEDKQISEELSNIETEKETNLKKEKHDETLNTKESKKPLRGRRKSMYVEKVEHEVVESKGSETKKSTKLTRRKSMYVERTDQESIVESEESATTKRNIPLRRKSMFIESTAHELNESEASESIQISKVKGKKCQIKSTESEESETTKRNKPLRRKSMYVERTPLEPDEIEEEGTKCSKTNQRKSLHVENTAKKPQESEEKATIKINKPMRRKSMYVERTPMEPDETEEETNQQKSQHVESTAKKAQEALESATVKINKPMRRKSMYAEKPPEQSIETEEETTIQSQTKRQKSLNVKNTPQDDIKEVKVNKPLKAIRRKSMFIESPTSFESETEGIEVNKAKPKAIRRKSMYIESPASLESENEGIGAKTETLTLPKSQTLLDNSQLTENCNEPRNNQQLPTKTIQSFKMRRKSMYVDSKSLNVSKEETENIKEKSSKVVNQTRIEESKMIEKQTTKDGEENTKVSKTLSENPNDIVGINTNETAKPIASFKMRRKSMYLERNSMKNEDIEKDLIDTKKSEQVKNKKTEENVLNIKRKEEKKLESDTCMGTSKKPTNQSSNLDRNFSNKQQMDTDSDSLIKQKNDDKMRRKSTNQRVHLDSNQEPKSPQESEQDVEKKSVNKRLKVDSSHEMLSGSDSPNIFSRQISIKIRRMSTHQLHTLDSNSPDREFKKNSGESKKLKQEGEKKTEVSGDSKKSKQDEKKNSEDKKSKADSHQTDTVSESTKVRRKSTNQRVETVSSLSEVAKQNSTDSNKSKHEKDTKSENSKLKIVSSQQTEERAETPIVSEQEKPIRMRRKSTIERNTLEQVEVTETAKSSISKKVLEEKSEVESTKQNDPVSTTIDIMSQAKSIEMRRKSTNPTQTIENSSIQGAESLNQQPDSDSSLVLTPHKSIKIRRKSTNQRRIIDSSSDDDEPLIKKPTVIENELKTPLTTAPKSRPRKKRVVKVLSSSMESPATNTNSSQQSSDQPSPLTSPNHPIFDAEVPTQSSEFVASMPMTPNQQDDNKFKEIDSKLNEIFQSPQYTVDYRISAAVDSSNLALLPPPSSDAINETRPVYNPDINQSSLNMSQLNETTSTLNDTSVNQSGSEIKHLSLGAADYRFEKVSDNVINLFISRKRKRKRNN